MAIHSSIGEFHGQRSLGGSMGSQRVWQDWGDLAHVHATQEERRDNEKVTPTDETLGHTNRPHCPTSRADLITLYRIFLKSLVQAAVSLHKEAKLQEAGTSNNPKDCSRHSNLPEAHLTHIWGITLRCGLPLPSPATPSQERSSKKARTLSCKPLYPQCPKWCLSCNSCCLVAKSCLTLCHPHGLQPTRILCPLDLPGKNTGVGCHALLQGIFPTQGSNPGLLHCRWILYQLNQMGSPRILEWVAYPFFSGSSQPRNQTRVSCTAGGFLTNRTIRAIFWHWHI